MIWLAPVLTICALLGYMAWINSYENKPPPPVDPAAATKAAIELHAIHRRLDVAQTRSALRRDAARLRRRIAQELEDDGR